MALRLRQDVHWWEAGAKRAIRLGGRPDPRQEPSKNWDAGYLRRLNDPEFEECRDGDVWRILIDPGDPRTSTWLDREGWIIGGYVLWCPATNCNEGLHWWSHARDCNADRMKGEPCKTGEKPGQSSCWTWTGTVEGNDLTATPSLFASGAQCNWHGFLTNGEMRVA